MDDNGHRVSSKGVTLASNNGKCILWWYRMQDQISQGVGCASRSLLFYILYVCRSTPGVPSLGGIVGDKKAFGQFIGRFKLINELS
jgi:hypothetical protein